MPASAPAADRIPTAIHRYEFLPDGTAQPFVPGNLVGANPATGPRVATPGGTYGTHQITNGGSGWDAVTDRGGSLVPATERGSLFAHYDFDLSDTTTLYAQVLAGNNEVNSVGTLPLGIAGWAGTIYSGNPFLPANIQQLMTANNIQSFALERYHTTADLAHDRFVTDNDTRSLTFGADAEIQSGVVRRLDDSAAMRSSARTTTRSRRSTSSAPTGCPRRWTPCGIPTTNEIVCRASLFDPANYGNCVPINLLGVGRASQAAIDYVLTGDQFILAKTEQNVVEFSMEGDIGDGWGAGAISLAFGGGWREESVDQTLGPDDIIALSMPPNDANAACTSNTVDLLNPPAGCRGVRGVPRAVLGHCRTRSSSSRTCSRSRASTRSRKCSPSRCCRSSPASRGVEQLDLTLSARYADYEGSGGIWAWKAGLDWQIHDAVRLRTTLSRDIRAATLSERFDRQGVGSAVNDPEFGGLNYTTTQIIGGNPNLNPEEADTLAFGVVWQPNFLEGFSMSADYYEIDIAGALAQVGVQVIVDQCFQGVAERCSKVTRDPVTNRVTIVDNAFVNQDSARVVGTDLEIGYTISSAGGGTLSARLLATWLNENSTTSLGAAKRDVAGETGDGSLPEFKSTTYLRYAKGPFSLFAQERFIGSGSLDFDDVEGVTIDDNSVDSRYYTDIGLTWGPERANLELGALLQRAEPVRQGSAARPRRSRSSAARASRTTGCSTSTAAATSSASIWLSEKKADSAALRTLT